MEASAGLKNCRVLIKDAKKQRIIADTKIQEFNPYKNTIKISASSANLIGEEKVSALIFGREGIYEYHGHIRKPLIANQLEVALALGKKKTDRASQRYELEIFGNVDALILSGQIVPLRKSIPVRTKNVSAVGALFEAMTGSLEVGNEFELYLGIGDDGTRGIYKVVRIQNTKNGFTEYGCRIIQMRKDG